MGRPLEKLSAVEVERKSRKLPVGKAKVTYSDGGGLYLRVGRPRSEGSLPDCSWIFRYMLNGGSHEMGLGPYPDITLLLARQKAQEARRLKLGGTDPIAARETARAAARLEAAKAITFRQCAESYIKWRKGLPTDNKLSWRNQKHANQWSATLEAYAMPKLGHLPVSGVDRGLLVDVLRPIWIEKSETASRVRQRIETILNWATASGYRAGENPAKRDGQLEHLLPGRKATAINHHAALPYDELPAFIPKLREQESAAAQALQFTILTAARTGEVINSTWAEFDLDNAVWIVPRERMKAGREHRVPLSKAALALLRERYKSTSGTGFVFPGGKVGKPLSNMAMTETLRRMGRGDITVHGFRSGFRTWVAERTTYPRELAEAALAHVLENKTEAAYQRGDLFEKRRKLMNVWATYVTTPPAAGEKVIPMRKPAG